MRRGVSQQMGKNANLRSTAGRLGAVDRRKSADVCGKVKLARLLQSCWHQGRTIGHLPQGVSIMSIAKVQNAAVALVGAVIFAGLFIGAALPVVPVA
jgi:hypothetical protein